MKRGGVLLGLRRILFRRDVALMLIGVALSVILAVWLYLVVEAQAHEM